MDHLQLPRNPTSRPPTVPYVCSVPYDGGDFLTYPARCGAPWNYYFESEWHLAFVMAERTNPTDDKLLEDFFQRWFFFGLLHAVLSHPQIDLYDVEDYIDRNEDGKATSVHTRNLAARLQVWSERVQNPDVDKSVIRQKLQRCIQLAYDTLSSLSSNKHSKFNQAIKCSIGDLGGTISAFGEICLGNTPNQSWNSFHGFATDLNTDIVTHMKGSGWCERDIYEENWALHSTAFYWYLRALGGVSPRLDHSKCSRQLCTVETVHRDSYTPGHVRQGCDCMLVGPDYDEVAAVLDIGRMPVLDITGESLEDISVKIVPNTDNITYVALSHVWADGLGNPSSLAVHQCQLHRLRDFLGRLYGRTFAWNDGIKVHETRKLHLWIDSLLVPIPLQPQVDDDEDFRLRPEVMRSWDLYRLAMSQIREVYSNATYVLVVDSALMSLPRSGMDAIEALVRIHASRWARRLWTLQEAALARKLLVQFSDEAIDYGGLELALRAGYQAPLTRRLCAPIVPKCTELRSLERLEETGGMSLEQIPLIMRLRRATDRADQPLCAAALFGLDTAQVAMGSGLAERMVIFWRLFADSGRFLPDNLIFNRMPRLTLPGYQWAPSALANDGDIERHTWLVLDRAKAAKLSDRGLLVHFPCIRISLCFFHFATETPLWHHASRDQGALHLRSSDGRWFKIIRAHPDDKNGDTNLPWTTMHNQYALDWHILLERDDLSDSYTSLGLLGSVAPQASGPPIFRSQVLVAVQEFHPANTIVAEAAIKHASAIRQGYSFRIYQLLFAFKLTLEFWVEFLPERFRKSLKSFFIPRLRSAIEPRIQKVVQQVLWNSQVSNQTSEVQAAMTRIAQTGADPPKYALMLILMELRAQRAVIDEFLDASHQWCIE